MRKYHPSEFESADLTSLGVTRRERLAFLSAFLPFALLGQAQAALPRRRTAPALWVQRQDEIARALASGQIGGRQWMSEVERLARDTDVDELLAHIAHARIADGGTPYHNDPRKRYVRFLDETGAPRQLAYGAAFLAFSPTNVVTPHGHRHMVSAHLVVDGRFRVRNFDRLRDDGEAMVVHPTRDYIARRGQVSTMSSDRDNIHWFVPQGGPARTFDVVISGLDAGQPDHDIRAIDVVGGERLADGAIRAPIMSFAASSARYTADV